MGAFLSRTAAYDSSLRGSHKVTYDKNKSKVYNFSGTSGQCTVQVVSWKD
jgi:hypothetical protein